MSRQQPMKPIDGNDNSCDKRYNQQQLPRPGHGLVPAVIVKKDCSAAALLHAQCHREQPTHAWIEAMKGSQSEQHSPRIVMSFTLEPHAKQ